MKRWIPALAVALAVGWTACGPRVARRPPAAAPSARSASADAALRRADGLVQRGCYLCLGDAVAAYRELLAAGFQPAAVRQRLFRATVLMAVRERELGIVPEAGREPTRPEATDPGDAPYAEMVTAIGWPGVAVLSGVPDDRGAPAPPLAAWRAHLTPLADAGDPFAAYLLIALDCTRGPGVASMPDLGAYTRAHPDALGLAFRAGACRPVDEAALRAVVGREPRFVEADFLLGQQRARRGEAEQAERHFRRVIDALPRLIAAPIALGDLLADDEEFEAALDAYDRALAVVPNHRQALLGRARSLSNLERHQEALAVCDTIIRLGEWYLGPAHYWRAWNLHALSDVEGAWRAIQAARRYLQTADVFDLAGVIAFDRADFPEAQANLHEALRRNPSLCRARFYLGRIQAEANQWVAAAASFEQASDCYAKGVGQAAVRLDEVRRSPALTDVRRAHLLERLEKQVTAGRHAFALAAYHAALGYANAGMPNVAIARAQRALDDEPLKRQVQELLAKLRK